MLVTCDLPHSNKPLGSSGEAALEEVRRSVPNGTAYTEPLNFRLKSIEYQMCALKDRLGALDGLPAVPRGLLKASGARPEG